MREPANASATSAGTCAFIAQVRSSWPEEPNLRPAMNTTLASFGSASTCSRSSRSAAMHSMPPAASCSRRPGSLKRATPITRLPGAARLASRARVGPILPPTPRMMRSPASCAELGDQGRRRRGHHLFEVLDVAEAIRKSGGRCRHPAFPQPAGDCAAPSRRTGFENPRIFDYRLVLFQIVHATVGRAPGGRWPGASLPTHKRLDTMIAPHKKRHPDALVSCRRAAASRIA